jgi:hypothetical protein
MVKRKGTTQDTTEPYRQVGARLREDQIAALDSIRATIGIPVTEQIRRAVDLWIASKTRKH